MIKNAVAQCSPEQLIQAMQKCRKITQKSIYAAQWDELMVLLSLTVYDANRILGKPDEYYDKVYD